MAQPYDAILLVSFGGPEKREDVLPFLENVVRGKRVRRQRLLDVAGRYDHFGGVSPLNGQMRSLLAALREELQAHGLPLPIYWGNRHWHPLLADCLRDMARDGVRQALAFVTSAFGSYPGCRQYWEDIDRARAAVGPDAPRVDKIRLFYNHPGFIDAMTDRVGEAMARIPEARRGRARLVYTAHSLPLSMASNSPYVSQLQEACRLVSTRLGRSRWDLVFQSRSGPPHQRWLEPDVCDHLRRLAGHEPGSDVILVPIGFLSEHMEVVYDLDVEAARVASQLGLRLVRAGTAGTHPRLVRMIRQLIEERLSDAPERLWVGDHGPAPDVCPAECCPPA